MDLFIKNINVLHPVADDLIKIFSSMRYDLENYKIGSDGYPAVRKDTYRDIHTCDVAGLVLPAWGVRCDFNRHGNYLRFIPAKDDRCTANFKSLVKAIPSIEQYMHTGSLLYENGFMSWHTNHDERIGDASKKDLRVYMTYNEDDASVFKYLDDINGVVVSVSEPQGWSMKLFDVTRPLWHCIKSGSKRFSVGTRFIVR